MGGGEGRRVEEVVEAGMVKVVMTPQPKAPPMRSVSVLVVGLLSVVVGVLGACACARAQQIACAEPARACGVCCVRVWCSWGGLGVGMGLYQRFFHARGGCENKARGSVRMLGTHLRWTAGRAGVRDAWVRPAAP